MKSVLFALPLFFLVAIFSGCASKAPPKVCDAGTQMYEGNCIDNEVVNYLACTKSRGFVLKEDKSKSSSTDVGFQFRQLVNVGTVHEAKSKIMVTKTPNDNEKQILDACEELSSKKKINKQAQKEATLNVLSALGLTNLKNFDQLVAYLIANNVSPDEVPQTIEKLEKKNEEMRRQLQNLQADISPKKLEKIETALAEFNYPLADTLITSLLPQVEEDLLAESERLRKKQMKAIEIYVTKALISENRFYYEEALSWHDKALQLQKIVFPGGDSSISNRYQSMASLQYTLGKYKEALTLYDSAEALEKNASWSSSFRKAAILEGRGLMYFSLGEYNKCSVLYDQAINLYMSLDSINWKSDLIGSMHNKIGLVWYRLEKPDKALSHYNAALPMFISKSGEKSLDVAMVYNNIGLVYSRKGRLDSALEFHSKALAIDIELVGLHHQYVSRDYINLGLVWMEKEDYPKALEYYNKSLQIDKALFGEFHPNVGLSYLNLGLIYYYQNNHKVAEENLQKSYKINKLCYGENHPSSAQSLLNLGLLYFKEKDYATALEFYNKALKIDSSYFGISHPNAARSLNNIGITYLQMKEYPKAEGFLKRALKIEKEYYTENHPSVARDYLNLGILEMERKNWTEARNYLQLSQNIYKAFYPETNSLVISVTQQLNFTEQKLLDQMSSN